MEKKLWCVWCAVLWGIYLNVLKIYFFVSYSLGFFVFFVFFLRIFPNVSKCHFLRSVSPAFSALLIYEYAQIKEKQK